MLLTRYAYRNLTRNWRRTVLTAATVGFAVCVVVTANQYIEGMMTIWRDGTVDHGTGHVQIHAPAMALRPDSLSVGHLIEDPTQLMAQLKADTAVAEVTGRMRFEGVVASGAKSVYFLGRAVDPVQELKVAPKLFTENVDRGRFLSASANAPEVVVGKLLAESLGVDLGAQIKILTYSVKNENQDVIDATIVGIIDYPSNILSRRLVLTQLATVQNTLGLGKAVTDLVVRLRNPDAAPRWKQQVEFDHANSLFVRGWWDIDPYVVRAEKFARAILFVVGLLLFVLAALSVTNMILMLVRERLVEIGTLGALGCRIKKIQSLVLLESIFIAALGCVLGVLISASVLTAMEQVGVAFRSPFGSGEVVIRPHFDLVVALAVSGLALLLSGAVSVLPAISAAKIEPVKAFRGQMT